MRSPTIVWATLFAFVFVLVAPPLVTQAEAESGKAPSFIRLCDGTLAASVLPQGPYGISVSEEGAQTRLFIAQAFVSTILVMFSACLIDGIFGEFGAGDGQLSGPTALLTLVALNRVYVVDCGNSRISAFSLAGQFLFAFGLLGLLPGQFSYPYGIAYSPSARNVRGIDLLYVADTGNHRIQYFDMEGVFQGEWGSMGTSPGQFSSPRGIAVDSSGNVYVSDTGNDRIQKFTSTGSFVTQWGTAGTGSSEFSSPNDLGVGPAQTSGGRGSVEAIYVADTGNDRVQIFTTAGVYLTEFGSSGYTDGLFNGPTDVDIADNGEVYVADQYNFRIQVFGYATSVETDSWAGIKAKYHTVPTE